MILGPTIEAVPMFSAIFIRGELYNPIILPAVKPIPTAVPLTVEGNNSEPYV